MPGPYVLVGHSTAGALDRLYTATYPRQVVGLVQVDGYSEFVDRFLTAAQSTALNDLNNGPLPGLKGYFKKLEKYRFAESFGQLRRAVGEHRLRNVPLTVITQSLGFELPPGLPGGLTSAVFNSAWTNAQDVLVGLEPGARHVIARRSGHYIMYSQPGLIIREIHRVVHDVRGARPG